MRRTWPPMCDEPPVSRLGIRQSTGRPTPSRPEEKPGRGRPQQSRRAHRPRIGWHYRGRRLAQPALPSCAPFAGCRPFHPSTPSVLNAREPTQMSSRARASCPRPLLPPPIPLLAPTIPPAASLPDPPQLHEKKSFTRACTLWLKPRACVRSSRPSGVPTPALSLGRVQWVLS